MKLLHRRCSELGPFLVCCLVLLSASTACRDTPKNDVADASAPAASVSAPKAAPAEIPTVTAAAATGADDVEEVSDAGADAAREGGAPRRRRLLVTADAGGALVETAPTPVPTAEPTTSAHGKRQPPAPMGNDGVYGGSAASGRPVLQKTPLPTDDPWKSPPPAPAPAQ